MTVENTVSNIGALTLPLASCWNTNDWDLNYYVKLIKQGHMVMPTIRVPLIMQGANEGAVYNKWFDKFGESLAFISEYNLPVTLRYHNLLNDFTAPRDNAFIGRFWRRSNENWNDSPLAWRIKDGRLDDLRKVDALGPIGAWEILGHLIGSTKFLYELYQHLKHNIIYILENNEADYLGVGDEKSGVWEKNENREWELANLSKLSKINYRLFNAVRTFDIDRRSQAINLLAEAYTTKRLKMHTAIKEACPWKEIYLGGFGSYGADGRISHRLNTIHGISNQGNIVWDIPSHRVYDARHHKYWWDSLDSPQNRAIELSSIWGREKRETSPFHEVSFWVDPFRDFRTFSENHNGPIGLKGLKGMLRYILWSTRQKGKSTVIRWYAGSKYKLNSLWYYKESWREALKEAGHNYEYTQKDMWETVLKVINEIRCVWSDYWVQGDDSRIVSNEIKIKLDNKELTYSFDPVSNPEGTYAVTTVGA